MVLLLKQVEEVNLQAFSDMLGRLTIFLGFWFVNDFNTFCWFLRYFSGFRNFFRNF